jgi:DNA-binding protein HU-beta
VKDTGMATRLSKKDVVEKLASRLSFDHEVAEKYLDAVTETLYDAFKAGEGVTLPSFGSFYLDRRRSGCVFKFNPSQKLKALFGWSSSYKGPL